MIALNRILVPTDFSLSSAKAVRYGVAFARKFAAKLYLLHVVTPRDLEMIVEGERVVESRIGESTGIAGPLALDELIHNAERELLRKLLSEDEQREIPTEYLVRASRFGGPYLEIVRYAKEHEVDLIIMGTHGRAFVAHMLMGSVAEKVLRRAPCPVLTVRDPEHEFVLPDVPREHAPST